MTEQRKHRPGLDGVPRDGVGGDTVGVDGFGLGGAGVGGFGVDVPATDVAGLVMCVRRTCDRDGVEVAPIAHDVLRDNAGRRMPAHLDVRGPADRPMSAMINAHSDRPAPRAWYHHRARRDRRRVLRNTSAMDDQPTRSGLARIERDRSAARIRARRERADVLLDLDCMCLGPCWESGACTDACTCRCEG
jgi:hypothetical protein